MKIDTTANPFESGPDELLQLALEECVKRQRLDRRVSILIIPALNCDTANQFAQMGAQVTLADDPACQCQIEGRILASGLRDQMTFVPYHLPELPNNPDGEPYDIVILRRSLCRMPYGEAKQFIRAMMQKMRIGGKLYLSILGLHSALGEDYAEANLDISKRFAELSPAIAKKYNIDYPVCLYSERNLFMLLLESGASVLRTFTTTYGNVKAVAVRV
jgi:hypothetical protein